MVLLSYIAFAVLGIFFYCRGGLRVNGDTNTLTSVLGVIGVIFTLMSRSLVGECQAARLQCLAGRAIKQWVLLESLNRMDIALRGSMCEALKVGCLGWVYRLGIPLLAILTSAISRKHLAQNLGVFQQPLEAMMRLSWTRPTLQAEFEGLHLPGASSTTLYPALAVA